MGHVASSRHGSLPDRRAGLVMRESGRRRGPIPGVAASISPCKMPDDISRA